MQKLILSFKSLYKFIIASLILAIPLYQKFPLISVPGTFVSIRIEDFLVLVSGSLFILFNYKKIKEYKSNMVFKAVLVFFVIALFSVVSSIVVTKTVNPLLAFVHYFRRVEYLSMLFVGYYAIKENRKGVFYYTCLIGVVVVLAFFYGLGQRYWSWPIVITQNQEYSKGIALRYVEGSHINSTFAGHYDLATYLVMFLPLMLGMFFYLRKGLGKYLFLLIYFAGLWLMVNSASRISMMSLLISVSLTLFLLKKLRRGFIILVVSVLFIGFSSNLVSRYARLFQIIDEKIKNLQTQQLVSDAFAQTDSIIERRANASPTPTPVPVFEDRSTSIRLNVEWPRALRAFSKNPLFGSGYSSITLASDNDYLRSLGETGLLGSLALLLVFAWLLLYFKISFKKLDDIEKVFVSSIAGGLVGVLINALFIDIFEASKLALSLWLFLGMTLCLMENGAPLAYASGIFSFASSEQNPPKRKNTSHSFPIKSGFPAKADKNEKTN